MLVYFLELLQFSPFPLLSGKTIPTAILPIMNSLVWEGSGADDAAIALATLRTAAGSAAGGRKASPASGSRRLRGGTDAGGGGEMRRFQAKIPVRATASG